MVSHILDLPPECLEAVLSFAPKSADQYNIALTCSAFRNIGLKTLWSIYENVDSRRDQDLARISLDCYHAIICSRPDLAQMVKHITIGELPDIAPWDASPVSSSESDEDEYDGYDGIRSGVGDCLSRLLQSLLMKLTRLETLELRGDFDSLICRWILSSSNPDSPTRYPSPFLHLAHLQTFSYQTNESDDDGPDVTSALLNIPVESIVVTHGYTTHPLPFGPVSETQKSAVRRLTFRKCDINADQLGKYLSVCPTLESLDFEDLNSLIGYYMVPLAPNEAMEHIQKALDKCPGTIRRLVLGSISNCDLDGDGMLLAAARTLNFCRWDRLEELMITENLMFNLHSSPQEMMEHLNTMIPPSVRKLRIFVHYPSVFGKTLDMMSPFFSPNKTSTLQNLRDFAVVCVMDSYGPGPWWGSSLLHRQSHLKFNVSVELIYEYEAHTRKFGSESGAWMEYARLHWKDTHRVRVNFSSPRSWYFDGGEGLTDRAVEPVVSGQDSRVEATEED